MLANPDIIPAWMALAAEIRIEMEMAETARAAGNEGRARVCARRAAGLAARDFLNLHHMNSFAADLQGLKSNSAYAALQALAAFPELSPDLKKAAINLTMRVNPNFQLPNGIDLIDEARKLIGGLK
jgi:hypothetical protein